jgi:hypothetical protein
MLDVNPIDPIEAYLIGKGDYEIYERGNGAEIFAV